MYSLFQSDRKNSDGDSEIQDPMKLAVKEILKDTSIQSSLDKIATKVDSKLQDVANRTLDKLREMNPEIAGSLNPVIPPSGSLKWPDVFKNVSITGDEDIPINKRGSGVKRLILLNFFRAEAERRKTEKNVPDIIYAIEEPETSQHPDHQKKLIDAFYDLSEVQHSQVIMTTHSPAIVKMLSYENLRLVKGSESKEVISVERQDLPYPSLNEVNYIAFHESDDGYHNELYGYIEGEGWLSEYKHGKPCRAYTKELKGNVSQHQVVLSEYIRHQIHHPENTHNVRYTALELEQSIGEMRSFIVGKRSV
jgi:hypothetical protein